MELNTKQSEALDFTEAFLNKKENNFFENQGSNENIQEDMNEDF